jgi:hypothetical protein
VLAGVAVAQEAPKLFSGITQLTPEGLGEAPAVDAISEPVATKAREESALAAALGESVAVAAVKKARADQHEAEQHLAELSAIALPAAREHLASAEREAAAARNAIAKVRAEEEMRKRIATASEFDAVVAEFARVFAEFLKQGRNIIDMPDALPRNMHGMTNFDEVIGLRRVAAALPPFVQKLFPGSPYDEIKKEPLATSEARYWNLPAAEEVKAA